MNQPELIINRYFIPPCFADLQRLGLWYITGRESVTDIDLRINHGGGRSHFSRDAQNYMDQVHRYIVDVLQCGTQYHEKEEITIAYATSCQRSGILNVDIPAGSQGHITQHGTHEFRQNTDFVSVFSKASCPILFHNVGLYGFDTLISRNPRTMLATAGADCVNMVIANPLNDHKLEVINSHFGVEGLYAGTLQALFAYLKNVDTCFENVRVFIAPALWYVVIPYSDTKHNTWRRLLSQQDVNSNIYTTIDAAIEGCAALETGIGNDEVRRSLELQQFSPATSYIVPLIEWVISSLHNRGVQRKHISVVPHITNTSTRVHSWRGIGHGAVNGQYQKDEKTGLFTYGLKHDVYGSNYLVTSQM